MEPNIKPITPRLSAGGDFGQTFFRHLQSVEGRAERIHTDPKGIPTLGAGTALAVRGNDGKFRLRQDLDKRIGQSTDGRHQLTPDERQRLQDTVNAINAGDTAKAKKLIPPNDPNEKDRPSLMQANNKFGFTVDDAGMRRLAQQDMDKARQSAWNDVEQVAKKAGWSDRQIADYKTKFESSKEMIGLASIKYSTGPGEKLPKTADAIVNGDRAKAVFEIEFNTNKNKDAGIANRRIKDAGFLSDGMSDADKKRLEQIAQKNRDKVNDYAKQFPGAFGNSSAAGMFKPGTSGGSGGGDVPSDPGQDDADGADGSPSGAGPSSSTSSGEGQPQSARLPDSGADSETKDFTPEQNNLLKDLEKNDGPLDDILAKDPSELTEGEFLELKEKLIDLPAGPEQDELDGMATAFLEDKFGTDPAQFDAVGRMIEPKPIRPINQTPVPARTPDGEPLTGAVNKIGRIVARDAGGEGTAGAVQGLQSGLNILKQVILRGREKPETRTPGIPPGVPRSKRPALGTVLVPDLKTDGIAGPKTRRALKIATSGLGRSKVEEGFALGRFGQFSRDVQTGRADGRDLGKTFDKTFGPLFPAKPKPAPKEGITGRIPLGPETGRGENMAFQTTVNDLGFNAFGEDKFQPILEDGFIGPKTETAFNTVLPAAGPDRFTSRLGHNLAFFDDFA